MDLSKNISELLVKEITRKLENCIRLIRVFYLISLEKNYFIDNNPYI